MNTRTTPTQQALESLYSKYNHRNCVGLDPLAFCYRFQDPRDVEVVGFLASALAYGRVAQITRSLEDLFNRIGSAPSSFARNLTAARRSSLDGFVHRFNTGKDIAAVLNAVGDAINRYGSLEEFFLVDYRESDENVNAAIDSFCRRLLQMCPGSTPGPGYLLSRPSSGSACKRLHLFMRWMVRRDAVDLGIWSRVDTAKLVVPTDVHMARLSAILGFHNHKSVSMKTALAITHSFAHIRPDDPARYDFALCRIGITEGCTGRQRDFCDECQLLSFCKARHFDQGPNGTALSPNSPKVRVLTCTEKSSRLEQPL